MEKKQYEVCIKVLKSLDKSGALKHLILIGSWCSYFYEQYFKDVFYEPFIKTRDLDFLVPLPVRIKKRSIFPNCLKKLDFYPGGLEKKVI